MQQSPSPSGRGVGVRGNEVTMVHHHGLRSPLIRPSGTFSRREKEVPSKPRTYYGFQASMLALSITKRYFTSPFNMRS